MKFGAYLNWEFSRRDMQFLVLYRGNWLVFIPKSCSSIPLVANLGKAIAVVGITVPIFPISGI
ncbi:hypothetical protein H6G86_31430 [Nostoc sp. FACHB-133]|nr:hypothetical protein [Nostoc sp. FACHB-133]